MRKRILVVIILILFATLAIITTTFLKPKQIIDNAIPTSMKTISLTSPSFTNNSVIPELFTCDGGNINPSLEISGVPTEAKSLTLIMEDPDAPAGTWTHWLKFNIPSETKSIAEAEEPKGVSGVGTSGNLTYAGPCPPSGTHRYFFKIYAVDIMLDLPVAAEKEAVLKNMAGHILGTGEIIGLYSAK